MRKKRLNYRLILVLGAILATLAAIELVFGLFFTSWHRGREPFDLPLDGVFHRASSDLDIGWEPAPRAKGLFQGSRVSINLEGLRSPEMTVAKPEQLKRIVVLGDSIVFGAGVDDEQVFCRRMEDFLAHRLAQPVEVLNLGVSGYNATQSVARFFAKGSRYEPDLVVVGFFNDDLLEPYVVGETGWWQQWSHRIFLFHLAQRIGWWWQYRRISLDTVLNDLDMEGWVEIERAREAYERLRDWADEHEASLLFALFPDLAAGEQSEATVLLTGWLRDWRVPALDLRPVFARASQDHLLRFSIRPETLDPHPNAEGHELIAQALTDRIIEGKLLNSGSVPGQGDEGLTN